ncbi:MAG: tRNA (adenosine(37)-N6)-threonylcarbamoyltransferase complex dimerization subunit type 1 TsaB [Sporolactobacillus sp.]
MKVLAIDSSHSIMGVAIVTETKVLGELMTNSRRNHSERLMPAIAQLLQETGTALEDVDRIAVVQGPGSYTGLRIGVTVAKTLAWTLDKELVGVSSLETAAQGGRAFHGYIVPFMDARRGQVFTGLYFAEQGRVRRVQKDRLVMMNEWLSLLEQLHQPVLFVSGDLPKWSDELLRLPWAVQGDCLVNSPRPADIALLGAREAPVNDIHHFLPSYLRLSEAEAKWLERQS